MTLYETSLLENTHKLDDENVEPAIEIVQS